RLSRRASSFARSCPARSAEASRSFGEIRSAEASRSFGEIHSAEASRSFGARSARLKPRAPSGSQVAKPVPAQPCAAAGRFVLPSGKLTDPDVPERDRELLILQADVSFRKSRVMDVQRRLAVQFDDEVIAVRGDLIVVPLIRLERIGARRLRRSDNSAGV